jgi:paraquat-inducible protein A
MPELAVLVGVFIILLPALILVLLVLTCVPLLTGYRAPWLRATARAIFTLQNWAMVEVFIISVIVSLVKIAALATVTLGISFWAYVGFAITFTLALVKLDRYQCWELIDAMASRR